MYKRIEILCKEKGVNVTQMCKEANVARAPLTELKMGRTAILSARNADKIASYFGVSVGYLLGTDDEKTPPAKAESVQYTDMELLEAFRSADERTRDAIRMLLGIKDGK
jgi:transcriptional regulator with XRE-family HTH domain